jgi:ribosomal-protein-alanine N-acetyltransferase
MINLRDYEATDSDRLVKLANNENVSKYLIYTFPFPYTKKDADWWIATGAHENCALNKVIEYGDEFVGGIGITPQIGWRSHIVEIGYWLGEAYWGRGIATEALRQMTEFAFFELKYKKLFGPVLESNSASMRVLEKNGYCLEGILKQEVFKNDQYFDIYHYAKYRS